MDEQQNAQPTTPPAGAPVQSGDKKHVLVVEDDIFIADLLGRKLHEHFAVHQASDAMQAEKLLGENPIQVICLDLMLPGKDGYTFLSEIKQNEKYKNIPVLILSNLGQKEEIERGLKSGASDYLVKANSSPEEIVQHVEKLLAMTGK